MLDRQPRIQVRYPLGIPVLSSNEPHPTDSKGSFFFGMIFAIAFGGHRKKKRGHLFSLPLVCGLTTSERWGLAPGSRRYKGHVSNDVSVSMLLMHV